MITSPTRSLLQHLCYSNGRCTSMLADSRLERDFCKKHNQPFILPRPLHISHAYSRAAPMYQHGSSLFEEPLDPDSEDEFEGEELDESDVWRNAVWCNAYDFYEGAPPARRLPSNDNGVGTAAVGTALAGAAAALARAAAAVSPGTSERAPAFAPHTPTAR